MKYQWNTGRRYDEYGQRIVASVEDGCILFSDISRHIDGMILTAAGFTEYDSYSIRSIVMCNYDFGNYTPSGVSLQWKLGETA